MKKIFLLSVFLLLTAKIFAQIPEALTYQAVARNASGAGLINSSISIRISIKNATSSGPTVYSETHAVTTNQFGLFTVAIGTGLIQSGVFASIDWEVGLKFMKVEMDATGGSSYIDMGTSQLLSVPYALVAGSVLNSSAGDDWGAQTAVTNTTLGGNGTTTSPLGMAQQGAASGQTLKWNGSQWAPANDMVGSGGDNWGSQSVVTNSTLDGSGTFASPLGMAQQGATFGQTLKWNGAAWAPANDLDNDIQTISIAGSTLSISNGNSVTIPSAINYSAGVGINIAGNVISNTGDLSNTNELQTLSVSGNQLTISNGNTVAINTGTNYTAGTGIDVTGTVISNTAPDQIVSLTATGSATITSNVYPNFTIDATDGQQLSITGNQLTISNGNSVNIPAQTPYTAGPGIGIVGTVISNTSLNTDAQNLSIAGNTLSISNGNSVNIPAQTPYTAGTGIGIAGTVITNSAPDQTVVLTGGGATTILSAYPNFTISSVDTDTDAQTLSLSGNDLSILNGNTITLPSGSGYTAGTGIGIAGTVISNSAPDQTVVLTGTGSTTITTSAYPNFTINSSAQTDLTLSGDGASITPLKIAQQGATSGQTLKWNGATWLPSNDIDIDAQTISLAGNILSISNGNNVTLPTGTTYTAGTGISLGGTTFSLNALTDATLAGNGAGTPLKIAQQGAASGQTLKWNGATWLPANDIDTDLDAQTISLAGNILSISNGNNVTLPTGTTYTAGTGISLGGTTFSLNALTDATLAGNGAGTPLKIAQQGAASGQTLKWNGATWQPGNDNDGQTLSIAGTLLSISNGNSVTLPAGTIYAAGSGISLTGTTFSNNAITDATIDGNGTAGTPLKIEQQGATVGQVLQWNGTTWTPGTISGGGTLGQIVSTVYGTDTLKINTTPIAWYLIPGLTQTITVPIGYTAYISTDGGVYGYGTLANQYSVVDIAVHIDNVINAAGGGYRRVYASNNDYSSRAVANWDMSFATVLSSGNHTIDVRAKFVVMGLGCVVSDDSSKPEMQGQLTIMLIKN